MSKDEYIKALTEQLSVLGVKERESAIQYYRDYIEDAQDEREALAQLGTPREVAAQILKEMGEAPFAPSTPKVKRSAGKTVWMTVLYLLASPFLLGFGAVALGLYVCLWGVVVCLCAALLLLGLCPTILSLGFLACGLAMAISGLAAGIGELPTMMFYVGGGVALASAGALLLPITIRAIRTAICWMGQVIAFCARITANLIHRRSKK